MKGVNVALIVSIGTIVVLGALLLSTGSQSKREFTARSIENPDIIGVLDNGQTLKHVRIKVEDESETLHVFYAGPDMTGNRIYTTRSGRVSTTHNNVSAWTAGKDVVIIDGQQLDPKEVEQAMQRDEEARRAGR